MVARKRGVAKSIARRIFTHKIEPSLQQSRVAGVDLRLSVDQMKRESVNGIVKRHPEPTTGFFRHLMHRRGVGQRLRRIVQVLAGLDHEGGAAEEILVAGRQAVYKGLAAGTAIVSVGTGAGHFLEAKVIEESLGVCLVLVGVEDVGDAHEVDPARG